MRTWIVMLCLCATMASAEEGDKLLLSRQAPADVELTANSDSAFWKTTSGVFMRHTILGAPATNLLAEIRSRWTPETLYFLFIAHYEELNLKTNADTASETYRLWFYDCMEAYVGSNPEHPNRYREFQISPQGEFLDLDIDSTKPRPGLNDERLWNSGMTVKARIDAQRKIWYGEMRIPMAAIDSRPPQVGDELRVNFCRQDGTRRERTFLAWQPTGAWTPHRPEKFGTLRLIANQK